LSFINSHIKCSVSTYNYIVVVICQGLQMSLEITIKEQFPQMHSTASWCKTQWETFHYQPLMGRHHWMGTNVTFSLYSKKSL